MNDTQKQIVELMKKAGLNEDSCNRALDYLETSFQQNEMLNFLRNNPSANQIEIMAKVKELIIRI
ncbi:MAG: hypothetical protein IKE91_03510 [Clostridia bacterium]|nr:hypothetical protein [Clostridia bacterium]